MKHGLQTSSYVCRDSDSIPLPLLKGYNVSLKESQEVVISDTSSGQKNRAIDRMISIRFDARRSGCRFAFNSKNGQGRRWCPWWALADYHFPILTASTYSLGRRWRTRFMFSLTFLTEARRGFGWFGFHNLVWVPVASRLVTLVLVNTWYLSWTLSRYVR